MAELAAEDAGGVMDVGRSVAGATWSVAIRGNVLLELAVGGAVNFVAGTGLMAGAAPKTAGGGCCAASFCFASGERA